MELKQQLFIIKGMQRDLSVSKFNPEFAFENMNIRITAKENSSLLSVTNEKGNAEALVIDKEDVDFNIEGLYLGHSILNNILILFTTDEGVDRIYRLIHNQSGNYFRGDMLFTGELNFKEDKPIETLCVFENENVQKVYWVDGLNQPRVINIAPSFDTSKYINTSFDFALNIQLNETISVNKNLSSSGLFSPGTIQYAFSYYNKYAQETSIFYVSPLNYISHKNRGVSPEDKVSNSFNIECFNLDNNFDSLRVYSIHRTTLDATPTVKKVMDLQISYTYLKLLIDFEEGPKDQIVILSNNDLYLLNLKTNEEQTLDKLYRPYTEDQENSTHQDYDIITYDDSKTYAIFDKTTNFIYKSNSNTEVIRYYEDGQFTKIVIKPRYPTSTTYVKKYLFKTVKISKTLKYTDNGTSGDIVDPTELLFKGSDNIVVGTMSHKDNTLFLGDIKLNQELISDVVKKSLKSWKIKFEQENTGIMTPDPKGYYPYESNLNHNSQTIKTFKYLEWYRFGILFQHSSGRWSEAIFLQDLQNTIPIEASFDSIDEIKLSQAKYVISNLNIHRLTDLGFVRARAIVSYPGISDRDIIALGILSPTVFNVQDRYTNSPFVQSSWFIRPNAPFDRLGSFNWNDLDKPSQQSINSKSGFWDLHSDTITIHGQPKPTKIDSVIHGSLSEFRHFYPIPDNQLRNAEIQCIVKPDEKPVMKSDATSGEIADYVGKNALNFYIDQSIFTFHSPELEFDESLKNMDSNNLKLRIVGMVPITSGISDVDITTLNTGFNTKQAKFYKELIGNTNISRLGAKGLNSAIMWIDSIVEGLQLHVSSHGKSYNLKNWTSGFMVYPWHRNGSLNNDVVPEDSKLRTAMLDKKKMSNMKYSYGTYYFNKESIWNAYIKGNEDSTGISGVEIFDSNEVTLTKLPSPKYSGLDAIGYYGNVDKVITSKEYPIVGVIGPELLKTSTSGTSLTIDSSPIFRRVATKLTDKHSTLIEGSEPIRMKYKSSVHAVMALNYTETGKQRVLPTIYDTSHKINYSANNDYRTLKPFWDLDFKGIHQDTLHSPKGGKYVENIGYGYLWLAELYNDEVINRFGGTTEEAIENNLWLPCGEPVSLLDENGEAKSNAEIVYNEGDTFYGRYDCLKTYPSTLEDLNSVVDIVSFMVESRVNLDGRYDRNRGLINNLTMSPTNFNKMNKAYSLNNNFFNYRSLNEERFLLNDFRNSVVWSKGKTLGELTDTWTNINLTSTVDLDGDKGSINALTRFNNEIIAFQDKGVSRILFNSRVLVNASDGIPIEISNSYKVDGKIYINETLGCTNKWSIKNAKSGLYFNDDLNKGIYNFNGETFTNITDTLGFNTYFNKVSTLKKWNALDFNNSVTFYDALNGDIYFVNLGQALCYSEKIGLFTSFYNYEKTPLMFNIGSGSFAFKNNKVWKLFAGDYNSFYGETKPYYVTVIANQEPTLDKIYTNLEFRADTWNGKALLNETTFDRLDIWNEYQHGELNLYMTKNRQSPLKKKFRMWSVLIPRDKDYKRDRIRNPWAFIKLTMEHPEDYRTELHDIIVNYFA